MSDAITGHDQSGPGVLLVHVRCPDCKGEADVLLDCAGSSAGHCPACDCRILSSDPVNGYVYVLSNSAMPGVLKIGRTNRPIHARIAELNAETGVPTPFRLQALYPSMDCCAEEARVHLALAALRLEGKEFFRLSPSEARRHISLLLGRQPVRTPQPPESHTETIPPPQSRPRPSDDEHVIYDCSKCHRSWVTPKRDCYPLCAGCQRTGLARAIGRVHVPYLTLRGMAHRTDSYVPTVALAAHTEETLRRWRSFCGVMPGIQSLRLTYILLPPDNPTALADVCGLCDGLVLDYTGIGGLPAVFPATADPQQSRGPLLVVASSDRYTATHELVASGIGADFLSLANPLDRIELAIGLYWVALLHLAMSTSTIQAVQSGSSADRRALEVAATIAQAMRSTPVG